MENFWNTARRSEAVSVAGNTYAIHGRDYRGGGAMSYDYSVTGKRVMSAWVRSAADAEFIVTVQSNQQLRGLRYCMFTSSNDAVPFVYWPNLALFGSSLRPDGAWHRIERDLAADITVRATTAQGAVSEAGGHAFVPKTPELFVHDDDGNLISDGRWAYTWDGENRLNRMEPLRGAGYPVSPVARIQYAYDYKGRRARMQVYGPDNDPLCFDKPLSDICYVWDGWNLAAELSPVDGSTVRRYLWNTAKGHKSLGAVRMGGGFGAASPPAQFAIVDGNDNVSLLLNGASDGAGGGAPEMSAEYEYGPFGEPLRATGPLAKANPVRFSSELLDTATGCYYYGYRYYNPDTGRWLSRDPIGEDFEPILYRFSGNNPVSIVDHMGLLIANCIWEPGTQPDPWPFDSDDAPYKSARPTMGDYSRYHYVATVSEIPGLGLLRPNAKAALRHYMIATGHDKSFDARKMLRETPGAFNTVNGQVLGGVKWLKANRGVRQFVAHSPLPESNKDGPFTASGNEDWYTAVGGYFMRIQGTAVSSCHPTAQGKRKVYMSIEIADRYNFHNTGASTVFGIPDDDFARFHKGTSEFSLLSSGCFLLT
ncbi:hypothetical protein CVU37_06435 [candidate division BRC1 bacterium HGW-BRC1-1]|jgi:RHS repeat-associated protein|nr:MAG: hypothetical protein CVU37_06435 [candidate division BRC1 bacterium HGW-BRC1-1]